MQNPPTIRPFFLWFIGPVHAINDRVGALVAQAIKDIGVDCAFLEENQCAETLWPEVIRGDNPQDENTKRLAGLCKILASAGVTAVVAAESPRESLRKMAREELGEYIEAYLEVTSDHLSESGAGAHLFEEPAESDLRIQADDENVKECAEKALTWLNDMGYLSPSQESGYTGSEESTVLKRLAELGYI